MAVITPPPSRRVSGPVRSGAVRARKTSSSEPASWAALRPAGVSWATRRPPCRTATWSASRSASSMYWVVSSTLAPPATRARTWSHRSWRARGSRPVVGSSRNTTCGPPTSVMARSSLRRMPPDSCWPCLRTASARPKRSTRSAVRRRPSRRGRWNRSAMRRRFSVTVSSGSTAESWPVTPISRRTACGSRATSWPRTRAVPPSAGSSVARIETVVVLPAPLGPSSAVTVPAGTVRSRPSSTVWSPYRLGVRRPRSPGVGLAGMIAPCGSTGGSRRRRERQMSRSSTSGSVA